MNWSHFQKDIFDAFTNTQDSLLIEAVAGSGKTRTLEELARIMGDRFASQRGVMVAFNKSIAMELQSRIDKYGFRNVQAMTLHSAGWAAWRRAGGLDWEPRVDSLKTHKIMREVLSYEENKRFGETTRKLVAAAKGIGLVPGVQMLDWQAHGIQNGLVEDCPEAWEALIDHYGLDEDECRVDCARRVLARGIEVAKETCDFDDMLYMPVIAGVPFDRYDVVLVDEAQDVSGIQMEMIGRMVGACPHDLGMIMTKAAGAGYEDDLAEYEPCGCNAGRVIAVGDRSQAIYGFRGAGTDSMDIFQRRFQMTELPLSVTYRCPKAVVLHAQDWVPQIEWAPGAITGVVFPEGTDWRGQSEIALGAPVATAHVDGYRVVMDGDYPPGEYTLKIGDGITKWTGIRDFQPGDAVLCRLTRPLVAAAFAMIRNRIACRVLGRDIGKGLTDIIKKAKLSESATTSVLGDWMGAWAYKQRERFRSRQEYSKLGMLDDKLATIEVFCEELEAKRGEDATIGELLRDIESLFVDNGGASGMVQLSTIHKFKGCESDRVFILDAGEFMPVPWGRGSGWELQQEFNLMYVAATRAKRELRYITTSDLR